MTQRRGFSESPAMRSSGAATGIPSRMPASSISTTTGPTTATTMSASAEPRNNRLDVGMPDGRTTLGRESPGADAPKARQHAQPETAALPTGSAVECGEMKRCSKCNYEFPVIDFYKKGKGRHARCKTCTKAATAAWVKANPEKKKASDAAYHKANREKDIGRWAAWCKANPEKNRSSKSKWKKDNPEKVRANCIKWHKANPEKINSARALRLEKLTDRYVARLIVQHLPFKLSNLSNIPLEMIEAKRAHLQLSRKLKESKNDNKNT